MKKYIKKTCLSGIFLILLLGTVSTVAATTNQKIYPVDSSVYHALSQLYILSGKALPTTAGPWSSAELLFLLERLDPATFTDTTHNLYAYVQSALSEELPSFSGGLEANLEIYAHTNTADFTLPSDWIRTHEDRKPLILIPLEISLIDGAFYGYTGLDIGPAKFTENVIYKDEGDTEYGYILGRNDNQFKNTFSTTLGPVWKGQITSIDSTFPNRAFAAFGGKTWTVQIGRDRLSWGPGITGNFILGDHLQYHNQGRFTAFSDSFKYTFVTSFFPSPEEIHASESQASPLHMGKMFMGHRFEGRLLNDRLGIALTENIMYQPENGVFDLRILNPFMLYHNYYIRQDANSTISLEVDFTPAPSWNIHAQIIVDEFAIPGEPRNIDGAHPDAMGYMLGARMVTPFHKGILTVGIEGAYTTPYLYLRSKDGDQDQATQLDSLNYVVALRRWAQGEALVYDQAFMGYTYGGDAIVAMLQAQYQEYGSWDAQATLFYMLHGEKNMTSLWKTGPGHATDSTPSGLASHNVVLSLGGTYHLSSQWKIYAQTDMTTIKNKGNSTKDWTTDLQLSVGASFCL